MPAIKVISDLAIPLVLVFVIVFALIKKVDVFTEFIDGVKSGIKTVYDIFPSLFALVLCVGMLRASGFTSFLGELISPLTSLIGFPSEATPLMLLRPFSGSGAIAVCDSILSDNGPDSLAGRVASVMLGSSETTFYVIAVYFAATKIKKTRHTLPSALAGDLFICILSAIVVNVLF